MGLSGASSAESEPRRGQKRSEGRRSRSVEAGAWAIALFMVAQTRRAQVCTEHEYVHESMQRPGPAQPAAATRGEHVDGSVVRVMLEPLTQAQRATIPQYTGPMWEAGPGER